VLATPRPSPFDTSHLHRCFRTDNLPRGKQPSNISVVAWCVGLSAPLGGVSSDRGIHSREEPGKTPFHTARSRGDCQKMQLPLCVASGPGRPRAVSGRWARLAWLERRGRPWKNCERLLNTSLQFVPLAFLLVLLRNLW